METKLAQPEDDKHDIKNGKIPDIHSEPEYDEKEGYYRDVLVLYAYWDGRHKKIPENIPEYSHTKIIEGSSKIGNSNVEYPREREHYTVRKFTSYSNGKSSGLYRVFDIEVENNRKKAKEIKEVVEHIRQLTDLEAEMKEIDSYDELLEKQEKVREYIGVYDTTNTAWEKDSLAGYNKTTNSRAFKLTPHRGCHKVPRLPLENINELIDDELGEDLGVYTIVWGGFLFEQKVFENGEQMERLFEVMKPFYNIPERGEK